MTSQVALVDYQELLRLGLTSPQGLDSLQACHRTDSPFSFVIDFQLSDPQDQWKRFVESWKNNQGKCQVSVDPSYQEIRNSDGSINQDKIAEMSQKYLELSEIVYSKSQILDNGCRSQTLSELYSILESLQERKFGSTIDQISIGSEIGNIRLLLRTPSKSKYGWTNLVLNIRVIK